MEPNVLGTVARGSLLVPMSESAQLPDACVGGGSNAIGLFHAFKDDDVAF